MISICFPNEHVYFVCTVLLLLFTENGVEPNKKIKMKT